MTNQAAIVFVVDDDPTFREALRGLVAAAGLRVELFGSAEEFLSSTRPDLPGCLVLGVRLPGMNGLEFQRELAARQMKVPVIFITDCGSIEVSVQAMKAGAVDFLTKSCHPSELLDAIHQAVERDRAARQERAELLELRHRFSSLTPREQQVMGHVVAGLPNKQIAVELSRSEITIKVHRGRLLRKMRAASLPDLVRMAHKLGIPAATE